MFKITASLIVLCGVFVLIGCDSGKASPAEIAAINQVQHNGALVYGTIGGPIKLDFTHMGIDEKGLEPVQEIAHLRELILAGTSVTDDDLQYLSDLDGLKNISLKSTQIGDDGIKHLSDLSGLIEIDLENTKITDAGLEHLAKISSLKKVWLAGTPVTIVGVKKLKEALPKIDIHGFE